MKRTIGVIGCGNMGEAIIRCLTISHFKEGELIASDKDARKRNFIHSRYKIPIYKDNGHLSAASDVIIIAVKPQDFDGCLDEIRAGIEGNLTRAKITHHIRKILKHKLRMGSSEKIIISVAAGITTGYIQERLGRLSIIRAMPNIASQIGEGMNVLCKGKFASVSDLNFAKRLFSCLGKSIVLDERLMDAVTAISGSGPAYLFYFIEGLMKAAGNLGLKKEIAHILVSQTIRGSLELLDKTGVPPEILRSKVTSKRGTTEAAIKIFEKEHFKKIIQDALNAARHRAGELSR